MDGNSLVLFSLLQPRIFDELLRGGRVASQKFDSCLGMVLRWPPLESIVCAIQISSEMAGVHGIGSVASPRSSEPLVTRMGEIEESRWWFPSFSPDLGPVMIGGWSSIGSGGDVIGHRPGRECLVLT